MAMVTLKGIGIRTVKVIGFIFSVVAVLLIISSVLLLLDHSSTITCNGVLTSSIPCKLSYLLFGVLFFCFGLMLLLIKQSVLCKFLERLGIVVEQKK